jgi:ABC-type Fe3+ transport system substrate-binding protein
MLNVSTLAPLAAVPGNRSMAVLAPPRAGRAWIALALTACLVAAPAFAADQALVDAAKREGEVVWYTTQQIDQLIRPIKAAFETKYGIKVLPVRANNTELAIKIINESRTGRPQVDVFDGSTTVVPLRREGYVLQWLPEAAKGFAADSKDRDGYWVATNLYVITAAFNTSLVPKGTEPRTLAALLDPRWKGKIAWSAIPSNSAGPGFVGAILADQGHDQGMAYLRDLSRQNIANLDGAARQVLDQVIAGEYPLALQIFNHHAVISARKGAPVEWMPIEPATAVPAVISVHKSAPHPNAGKLLVEFVTSREGQQIFRDLDYLPADPGLAPLDPSLMPDIGKFRARFFTPEETAAQMPDWTRVFNDLFR